MTPAEQRDFLTHTRLYLSKDVKRIQWGRDLYIVKHTPTGARMRVSSEQLFVLGQFGRGATVAELVPQLIMNRRCIPLKELYEFVLQARAANVLNEQRDEEFSPDYPPRWWPSLDLDAAQMLWWLSCFAGLGAMIFWAVSDESTKPIEQLGWLDALVAWPVASLCASLGGLMASAYVHRVGCDIRRPKLIWKSLIPRVGFDWEDIDMTGPEGHKVVAKLRIMPFLLAAFVCTVVPALHLWAPVAVVVLLWRVAPLPGSAVVQWLESGHRRLLLDTDRPRYFYHHGQSVPSRVLHEFRATDWGFLAMVLAWTAVWFSGCCWFVGAFLCGKATAIFPMLLAGSGSETLWWAVALSGVAAIAFIGMLISGWVTQRRDEQTYGHLPRDPAFGGMSPAQIIEDCPLFRELPVEVREELVAMSRTVVVKSGQHVVGVGEKG